MHKTENQLRCKINIGDGQRRMAAQKADMGELGEKTITDFLRVPGWDWWKKVTKTLQKLKSKCKKRNIQYIQLVAFSKHPSEKWCKIVFYNYSLIFKFTSHYWSINNLKHKYLSPYWLSWIGIDFEKCNQYHKTLCKNFKKKIEYWKMKI